MAVNIFQLFSIICSKLGHLFYKDCANRIVSQYLNPWGPVAQDLDIYKLTLMDERCSYREHLMASDFFYTQESLRLSMIWYVME